MISSGTKRRCLVARPTRRPRSWQETQLDDYVEPVQSFDSPVNIRQQSAAIAIEDLNHPDENQNKTEETSETEQKDGKIKQRQRRKKTKHIKKIIIKEEEFEATN